MNMPMIHICYGILSAYIIGLFYATEAIPTYFPDFGLVGQDVTHDYPGKDDGNG